MSRQTVVIIVLAIAVAALGALCGWLYVDIGRLQNEKMELETRLALYTRWLEGNKTKLMEVQNLTKTLENEVAILRGAVEEKDATITSLRSQVAQLQNQISYLQSRVRDLEDIVYLRKYVVWIDKMVVNQPAGYYTYWRFNADYAGYVVVEVHSSTTTNTYVRVTVESSITTYSVRVEVGSRGRAIVPVLPGTVEVRVGNTNRYTGATHTVSVTYYY